MNQTVICLGAHVFDVQLRPVEAIPDDAPNDDIARATHLHVGGPELMGGEGAAEILSRATTAGVVTSADILTPADPGVLGRDLGASARLGCAAAALVAQGLGSDHGDFDLATADAFAETAATI